MLGPRLRGCLPWPSGQVPGRRLTAITALGPLVLRLVLPPPPAAGGAAFGPAAWLALVDVCVRGSSVTGRAQSVTAWLFLSEVFEKEDLGGRAWGCHQVLGVLALWRFLTWHWKEGSRAPCKGLLFVKEQ